jgi:uncharacterized DUF497 family protein
MHVWDENKRLTNIANHAVDFRDLVDLNWDRALIFEDRRRDYGEARLIAMAALGRRLHVVVFVERDGDRRIISARKANSREVAFYERETHPTKS